MAAQREGKSFMADVTPGAAAPDESPAKANPAIPEPLRDAALTLFAEQGYAATGIRDIARRSGMSSAAMYHYFGSKQDLLFALMHDIMVHLLAVAEQALDGAEGPDARIAALVRCHIRLIANHNPDTTVNENELRSLEPANRRAIADMRDAYEHLWRDAIARGIAEGTFQVPDARLASFAAISMCTSVPKWYAPTGSLSPDQIADAYVILILNMLRGGA
jgi:AcrR family transcriptional regulator